MWKGKCSKSKIPKGKPVKGLASSTVVSFLVDFFVQFIGGRGRVERANERESICQPLDLDGAVDPVPGR